jgi:hypothetical protein
VSAGAVRQGVRRAREGGPEALQQRPRPGAPRRWTTDPLARLPHGAAAYGVRGQGRPWGRIAVGMRLACGLASPPVPVARLCQALSRSPPTPALGLAPARRGAPPPPGAAPGRGARAEARWGATGSPQRRRAAP